MSIECLVDVFNITSNVFNSGKSKQKQIRLINEYLLFYNRKDRLLEKVIFILELSGSSLTIETSGGGGIASFLLSIPNRKYERCEEWRLQLAEADSGGRFSIWKASLQDSIAFAAAVDDGRDAARGGHLYLQSSSSALLATKWKWVYCRIAEAPANQQQQLLVYDSIESSSDPASQPLETIPLQSARCFAQLEQGIGSDCKFVLVSSGSKGVLSMTSGTKEYHFRSHCASASALWIQALQTAAGTSLVDDRRQMHAAVASAFAVPSRGVSQQGVSQAPPTDVSIYVPREFDAAVARATPHGVAIRHEQREQQARDAEDWRHEQDDAASAVVTTQRQNSHSRISEHQDPSSSASSRSTSRPPRSLPTASDQAATGIVPAPPPRSRSIAPATISRQLQLPITDPAATLARTAVASRSMSQAPTSLRSAALHPASPAAELRTRDGASLQKLDSDPQVLAEGANGNSLKGKAAVNFRAASQPPSRGSVGGRSVQAGGVGVSEQEAVRGTRIAGNTQAAAVDLADCTRLPPPPPARRHMREAGGDDAAGRGSSSGDEGYQCGAYEIGDVDC